MKKMKVIRSITNLNDAFCDRHKYGTIRLDRRAGTVGRTMRFQMQSLHVISCLFESKGVRFPKFDQYSQFVMVYLITFFFIWLITRFCLFRHRIGFCPGAMCMGSKVFQMFTISNVLFHGKLKMAFAFCFCFCFCFIEMENQKRKRAKFRIEQKERSVNCGQPESDHLPSFLLFSWTHSGCSAGLYRSLSSIISNR